jgi:hypothetical protein
MYMNQKVNPDNPEPEYYIPLSPVDYQIMLALAGRPLHGTLSSNNAFVIRKES